MLLTMGFIREHCACLVRNESHWENSWCQELISPLMMSIPKTTGTPLAIIIQTTIFFTFAPIYRNRWLITVSCLSQKVLSLVLYPLFLQQHSKRDECVTRWRLFRKLKGKLLSHTRTAGCKVSQAILGECARKLWMIPNHHSGATLK